ncbi:hypothetical protein [Embleya scabrispora]|uniref:hypothetical protein n=1 Tax=Embleya scabrispora TaxID=159449 RepID=UPI00099C0D89|nr:hypothetical protein [Embleya scabrispora]
MRRKVMWLTMIIQASIIVGLSAGILQAAGGSGITGAIQYGAGAFAGSVALGLLVTTSLKIL